MAYARKAIKNYRKYQLQDAKNHHSPASNKPRTFTDEYNPYTFWWLVAWIAVLTVLLYLSLASA